MQKTQTQQTSKQIYGFDVKQMSVNADKRIDRVDKTYNGEKPFRFVSATFEDSDGTKKRVISEVNSNDFLSNKNIDLTDVKSEIDAINDDVKKFIVKQSFNNKMRKLIKNLL